MSKSKLNNNNNNRNSNQLPVQLSAQPVQIGNNENIIFEILDGTVIVIETINNSFGLILRNPLNPTNGLMLTSNENPDHLVEIANGLLNNLGDEINFLFDSRVYNAFQNDNNLVQYLFSTSEKFRSMVLSNIENNNNDNLDPPIIPSAPPMSSVNSINSNNDQLEHHEEEEEEHECPVCMENLTNDDACMRCAGAGGRHHYFHARCLTQWIRQCRNNSNNANVEPTCPVCRQSLEFNRARLNEFLDTNPSAPPAEILTQEERTYFENVLAGLAGERNWEGMSTTERIAYTGGLVAAAGTGFMMGYYGTDARSAYYANEVSEVVGVPDEHRWVGTVGWVAGVVVRGLTYLSSTAAAGNKDDDDDD